MGSASGRRSDFYCRPLMVGLWVVLEGGWWREIP